MGYSLVRAAGFVAAFIASILFAHAFGQDSDSDAYFVAILLPMCVLGLGQSLIPLCTVPVLSGLQAKGEEGQARFLTRQLYSRFFLGAAIMALVGWLLNRPCVELLGAHLSEKSKALATQLFSWTSAILFLVALLPMGRSVLQARQRFFRSVLDALCMNVGIALGILLLSRHSGLYAPLYGMLAGLLVAVLVQLPIVIKEVRGAVCPCADALQNVWNLGWPLFLAQAFSLIQLLLSRRLASDVAGGITALSYSERILGPAPELISFAIGAVLLPRLSMLQTTKQTMESDQTALRGVQMALFLLLACTGLVFVLSEDVVRLIYQRGAFRSEDTVTTGRLLATYAFVLPSSASYVVVTSLLTRGRIRAYLVSSIGAILIYVPCVLAAARWAQVQGIVLASVVTNSLLFAASLVLLLSGVAQDMRRVFFKQLSIMGITAVLATAGAWFLYGHVQTILPLTTHLHALLRTAIVSGGFFSVYVGVAWFLGSHEISHLLSAITSKQRESKSLSRSF